MADFPIPRRNVLRSVHNISSAISRIVSNFRVEQQGYRHMRRKYRTLGARSLQRQATAFLTAHAASVGVRKYKKLYGPHSPDSLTLKHAADLAQQEGFRGGA
jgi:hypothetical protein